MTSDPAPLSPARLARLHDVLTGHVDRGAVSGLVALVERRGQTHLETLGHRALVGAQPMRPDSLFRIASVTKPITAVAGLMLVEDCVVGLDDPVDELLPELADRRVLRFLDGSLDDTVPAERPITVRDLFTFQLGYGVVLAAPDSLPIQRAWSQRRLGGTGPPRPARFPPADEWLRRLGELPLMHQPGERWMYDTGADVLGVLIARATGEPLEAVLRRRIFEPLGMVDTGFSVAPDQLSRLTTSYDTDPDSGAPTIFDGVSDSEWLAPTFASGAGGLVSTAADLAAFGRMLLHEGRYPGGRLLSRPTVRAMLVDQLSPAQKAVSSPEVWGFGHSGWGLGLSVVNQWEPGRPGGFGWDGGLGTSWYFDPAQDLVGVLLTQSTFTSPSGPKILRDFWTCVYAAIDD
ncbi:MAG TPA: serine hydrolase domain-containing protein [Pseudonocardia sp.]|nr:serine hydrolase domain-containing protein [Pseudonocardia sp.]